MCGPGVTGRPYRAVKGKPAPDIHALEGNVVIISGRGNLAPILSIQHIALMMRKCGMFHVFKHIRYVIIVIEDHDISNE